MKRLACLVILGVLSSALFTQGQSSQARTDQFVVGPWEVLVPEGVFLLVRRGQKIGAVRFTKIEPGSEVGTGKASYESYFQESGSGSFQNLPTQSGEIKLKPLKGIGRLAFQTGNDKIRIGNWSFLSSSPGAVSMWPYRGSEKDYGYEFAPTSARDVREIDASDQRLRWFRFNNDSRVLLKVSELPK